mmetsp:Transcript_85520/g.135055  ORF Transcript_85520/g.135055 Transcript_85520/m.135055 type:complete len:234 (-) Transcript_85520:803-1504(-)
MDMQKSRCCYVNPCIPPSMMGAGLVASEEDVVVVLRVGSQELNIRTFDPGLTGFEQSLGTTLRTTARMRMLVIVGTKQTVDIASAKENLLTSSVELQRETTMRVGTRRGMKRKKTNTIMIEIEHIPSIAAWRTEDIARKTSMKRMTIPEKRRKGKVLQKSPSIDHTYLESIQSMNLVMTLSMNKRKVSTAVKLTACVRAIIVAPVWLAVSRLPPARKSRSVGYMRKHQVRQEL